MLKELEAKKPAALLVKVTLKAVLLDQLLLVAMVVLLKAILKE